MAMCGLSPPCPRHLIKALKITVLRQVNPPSPTDPSLLRSECVQWCVASVVSSFFSFFCYFHFPCARYPCWCADRDECLERELFPILLPVCGSLSGNICMLAHWETALTAHAMDRLAAGFKTKSVIWVDEGGGVVCVHMCACVCTSVMYSCA